MNNVSPKTDPWGTPCLTFSEFGNFPFINTDWDVSLKYDDNNETHKIQVYALVCCERLYQRHIQQ